MHGARFGRAGTVLVVVSALALTACSSGRTTAPSNTALVTRASISTGVSSSGSLSAITTQDLGFAQGGQLKKVSVKVGDHVTAGETLATIDSFALTQSVKQAKASLAGQQAALYKLSNDPSVSGGNSTLAQARSVVAATQRQVSATKKADAEATHRAGRQLRIDKYAQHKAEDLHHDIEKACSKAKKNTTSSEALAALSEALTKALDDNDVAKANELSAELTLALSNGGASTSAAAACGAVGTAESAVVAAKQRVVGSRTGLRAAQQKRKVDIALGELSVENAQQGVVAAQNALSSTTSGRPFNLDAQRALVSSAESAVSSAEKNLHDATLKAPFEGTVAAINGTVGEFLSPSNGTTALAPGTAAAIPGTDTSGGSAGSSGGAAPTRPGGSAFLVLTGIKQLQVVLPFEESDAAKIVPKQHVTVNFDAVPDLVEQGTVDSVAPTGTAISGVVSYYVTVRLNRTDKRLRDGQTARATVATTSRTNVLTVPNNAVRAQGADSTVVVVEPAGDQRTVVFQPGLVGPDRTEVLSGLTEGQRVVVPSGP